MSDSDNAVHRFLLKYPRPVGAVLTLLGAAGCYWSIVRPIQLAEAGTPEIRISVAMGTLAVMLTVIGLIYTVCGAWAVRIFRPPAGESKASAYTLAFVLLCVGLGVYLLLQVYLASKGYSFRN